MTIIVPTDFTPTSLNAARYAVRMLDGQEGATVVLYHAYDDAYFAPNVQLALLDTKEALAANYLMVICKSEHTDSFTEGLERLVRHYGADAVVMGLTDRTKWDYAVLGSHALKMANKALCPVLIVPEGTEYAAVKKVALACDFNNIEDSIPVAPITKLLRLFRATLSIIHVSEAYHFEDGDWYVAGKEKLRNLFVNYTPSFHFLETADFTGGIHSFVEAEGIDILFTIPKSHNMLTKLVRGSYTRKLVLESKVPVVAAHE